MNESSYPKDRCQASATFPAADPAKEDTGGTKILKAVPTYECNSGFRRQCPWILTPAGLLDNLSRLSREGYEGVCGGLSNQLRAEDDGGKVCKRETESLHL